MATSGLPRSHDVSDPAVFVSARPGRSRQRRAGTQRTETVRLVTRQTRKPAVGGALNLVGFGA